MFLRLPSLFLFSIPAATVAEPTSVQPFPLPPVGPPPAGSLPIVVLDSFGPWDLVQAPEKAETKSFWVPHFDSENQKPEQICAAPDVQKVKVLLVRHAYSLMNGFSSSTKKYWCSLHDDDNCCWDPMLHPKGVMQAEDLATDLQAWMAEQEDSSNYEEGGNKSGLKGTRIAVSPLLRTQQTAMYALGLDKKDGNGNDRKKITTTVLSSIVEVVQGSANMALFKDEYRNGGWWNGLNGEGTRSLGTNGGNAEVCQINLYDKSAGSWYVESCAFRSAEESALRSEKCWVSYHGGEIDEIPKVSAWEKGTSITKNSWSTYSVQRGLTNLNIRNPQTKIGYNSAKRTEFNVGDLHNDFNMHGPTGDLMAAVKSDVFFGKNWRLSDSEGCSGFWSFLCSKPKPTSQAVSGSKPQQSPMIRNALQDFYRLATAESEEAAEYGGEDNIMKGGPTYSVAAFSHGQYIRSFVQEMISDNSQLWQRLEIPKGQGLKFGGKIVDTIGDLFLPHETPNASAYEIELCYPAAYDGELTPASFDVALGGVRVVHVLDDENAARIDKEYQNDK